MSKVHSTDDQDFGSRTPWQRTAVFEYYWNDKPDDHHCTGIGNSRKLQMRRNAMPNVFAPVELHSWGMDDDGDDFIKKVRFRTSQPRQAFEPNEEKGLMGERRTCQNFQVSCPWPIYALINDIASLT